MNLTDNQNNLVSRLATRRRLAIGEDWSQDVHFGEQSELRYSYHVFCDEYYFGDGCAEYCRPRDDTLGHYTCDEEGSRICLEGWKGNYCSECKFNPPPTTHVLVWSEPHKFGSENFPSK